MCAPIVQEENQLINTAKIMSEGAEETLTNPIAKHWVRLYRAVPVIYFPFTALDISFSLFSAAFLYAVRLILKKIMIHMVGWQPEDAAGLDGQEEAMGSLTAMVHSLNLVPALFVALTTQPYRITTHLNTAPRWWQDMVHALFQFCTGYMIYDSIASFIVAKGISNIAGADFMFLGHHLATTIYMTQCRVLQAGHTSAMICMFLGELTNPFQNGHTALSHALKDACCSGVAMQQLHKIFEIGFAMSYFGIRAIIAPVFFAHVTFQLLFESTRKNIPLMLRILWIILIWAVELGSYAWIMQCWDLIQMHLGASSQAGETVTSEL